LPYLDRVTGWHIDHRVPLSIFEIIRCFRIAKVGDDAAEVGRSESGILLTEFLESPAITDFVEKKVDVGVRVDDGDGTVTAGSHQTSEWMIDGMR